MKRMNMANQANFLSTIGIALLGLALSGCGGSGGSSTPAPVAFTNGQNAAVVIGEPDFVTSTGGITQNTVSSPYGNADVVSGVLYLGDYNNNRVLGFNSIPTSNGANADFVLGASDFVSVGNLNGAQQVAHDNGYLYVAEYGANAIAVFNPVPTASTSAPTATTPQTPSFSLFGSGAGGMSYEETVSAGGGKLVSTDSGNNRVLIWNTLPTADATPDLVLGQTDFTGTSANQGLSAPTASTMDYPAGIWTDGTRLVVVDQSNNRVLIWNTFPTANDQPADLVLGQPDFVSNSVNQGLPAPTAATMHAPYDGVYVNGDQLFVADDSNNRVLIWNTWPTTNDQPADGVLGQSDFVSNASATTQSGLSCPEGVTLSGKQLIVTDECNNRYMVFNGS